MNLVKVLIRCLVDQHLTEMELVSLPVNVNLKEDHPREAVLQGKYIYIFKCSQKVKDHEFVI